MLNQSRYWLENWSPDAHNPPCYDQYALYLCVVDCGELGPVNILAAHA